MSLLCYFIDWLSCYQDFDFDLPIISDDGFCHVDFIEGSDGTIEEMVVGQPRQRALKYEGSYSTSITIHVKHRRIYIAGNPSRFNRLDNLFGLRTLEQCIAVYNRILVSLGLPEFTRCTQLFKTQVPDKQEPKTFSDGLVITGLHYTTNVSVGAGCVDAYLKAVSTLPFRNSPGRLHSNGKTADWLSIKGNARDLYPKLYDKAHELQLHLLDKVKRRFGDWSPEYEYVSSLIADCKANGVVRYELEFHQSFLNKNTLQYWGLSNLSELTNIFLEFIHIDQKLQVSAMDLETISETLLRLNICENTKAANTTAFYAYNWMNGQKFDPTKAQIKVHRARLRKIGIDILKPCDLTKFSPVIVKEVIEIERKTYTAPAWYRHPEPSHLRLVA